MRTRALTVAAGLAGLLAACTGDAVAPGPRTSFERLQARVIDRACVSCHTPGTTYAQQSGLVLDDSVAYRNLVGATPTNASARAAGLRRVTPYRPDSSLLWHKLNWASGIQSGTYGNPMPLGGAGLSIGQLEFVRRWILEGAPRSGDRIDPALLDDTTSQILEPFVPLPPPAQGLQLRVDSFAVAPEFERELFVYRALGNVGTVFVNRIETRMRVGSHHLALYTLPAGTPSDVVPPHDVIRDIRNSDGTINYQNMRPMGYHVFFGGGMTSTTDYRLPDGVALRVSANASIDVNSHYVNKTLGPFPGEVYANLHTMDSAAVQHSARTINFNNFDIYLPARQRATITRTFVTNDTLHVIMLTSHMHRHGERFAIRIYGGARNGEVVYQTENWAHPDIVTYAPPIVLLPGEGLTSEVTYNNTSDRVITFGLTSEDEMGIIFGYFYYR